MHASGARRKVKKKSNEAAIPDDDGSSRRKRGPLLVGLRRYLNNCVSFPAEDRKDANELVESIKQGFQQLAQDDRSTPYTFGNIMCLGSSYEGLKVIAPNEFDLAIPITLKNVHFGYQQADSECEAPGYFFITKNGRQSNKKRCDTATFYKEYLSPIMMKKTIESITKKVLRYLELPKDCAKITHHGPALTIEFRIPENDDDDEDDDDNDKDDDDDFSAFVLEDDYNEDDYESDDDYGSYDDWEDSDDDTNDDDYDEDEKSKAIELLPFSIDIVPSVKLKDKDKDRVRLFVAKPHPKADIKDDDNIYNMLWQESFSEMEKRIITKMDKKNECRRDCLKIMKAIRIKRGSSQLSMLTSYHLKTCMLHLNADKRIGPWHQEYLDDRFKDFVRKLIHFLKEKRMPHFFAPSIDLFALIQDRKLHDARRWLSQIIVSDDKIINELLSDC